MWEFTSMISNEGCINSWCLGSMICIHTVQSGKRDRTQVNRFISLGTEILQSKLFPLSDWQELLNFIILIGKCNLANSLNKARCYVVSKVFQYPTMSLLKTHYCQNVELKIKNTDHDYLKIIKGQLLPCQLFLQGKSSDLTLLNFYTLSALLIR